MAQLIPKRAVQPQQAGLARRNASLIARTLVGITLATAHSDRPTPEMLLTWSPDATEAFKEAQATSNALEGTSQDCAMRRLAMEFAIQLQPERVELKEVYDALRLHSLCNDTNPLALLQRISLDSIAFPVNSGAVYVDPNTGDDTHPGTEEAPLSSVAAAVARTRISGLQNRTIILRAGLHHINSVVELSPADSNLTFVNFPSEKAWLSGAKRLNGLQWSKYGDAATNIWKATLPVGFGDVSSLIALSKVGESRRQTRARHPNRQMNVGSMEKGLWRPGGSVWMKPDPWSAPAKTVTVKHPNDVKHHAHSAGAFWTYGVGGPCDRFDPPGSYQCSANQGANGFPTIVKGAPLFPIGLIVNDTAFNTSGVKPPSSWQPFSKTGAKPVVETWTNGWATTFWEVEAIHDARLEFGRGGNQLAWGSEVTGHNASAPISGGPWMIENALELLDQPEEWFFAPATRELFLWHNGTGPPSTDSIWLVPQLKELFRIVGSKDNPVVNISFLGVGFRDTAPAFLEPRGVPSGGDWTLHRGGALFIDGAADVTVDRCSFLDLGGNAIFLSGWVRRTTIANSSFAQLGESAIATWGRTRDLHTEIERRGSTLPVGVGIDGTHGEQPRATRVLRNFVRDIGLYERQSSAFGEFKACQSHVEGNIVFNIPRAAININDGFGGGTVIKRNLFFNTCRESGDHGPVNTWDRQPYLSDVRRGKPSLVPAYNRIFQNFMFANYGAGLGVDNDDTSSYYDITGNVLYQGGGLKCDYAGHDKYFSGNLLVQTNFGACSHTCAYKKPFTDHCFNNTIVQTERKTRPGFSTIPPFATIWFCNATDPSIILPDYGNEMLPIIHSNRIFNSNGSAVNVTCGYSGNESKLNVPLERFLELGLMHGTTVQPLPSVGKLMHWARLLLHLPLDDDDAFTRSSSEFITVI